MLCTTASLLAQTAVEPVNSDRPDQSEGPYVLPRRLVQVETGTLYEPANGLNAVQNTMLRFGLNGSTEARLLIDAGYANGQWQVQPIGLSVKQKLVRPQGARPDVALVTYVRLHPLATGEVRQSTLSSAMVLAAESAIEDRLFLTYTVGGAFADLGPPATAIFTTEALYRPRPDLAVFVEYFGNLNTTMLNGVDAGIMYHPMPLIMLDVAAALINENGTWGGYITGGLSFRMGDRRAAMRAAKRSLGQP
jgi:hypothetical protein